MASATMLAVLFGILALIFYVIWAENYRYDLGTWFPTAEQRALVNERNAVRKDWLALSDAIENADHFVFSNEMVARLEKAKRKARERLDLLEDQVRAARAGNSQTSKYDALLAKWK